MKKFLYSIGNCYVCGQGDAIIVRGKYDNNYSLICDDCETQWENPEFFFKFNGNNFHKDDLEDIEEDELEITGWKDLVIGLI